MKEISEEIITFVKERHWDQLEHPDSLIKSIVVEAGELLECIQWDINYDINQVSEELADVLIYCFQLAYSLDLDIKTIIEAKLAKNRLKYPVEK
ncbi:nucleotide pyrophosphohydrolase [uncultured Thomasclavelia sp.]|uniref:nucleotide pyrophosphohydrolase n=1 Tax=uncultured Thomasclavelia sp. TaxID=3025759 RepID=UPI0025E32296|nr:nucleotide pyrophosphohydrolase [uncultured Thomasclavelia sp.]